MNNGSVLSNGSISWLQMQIHFWRSIVATALHYLAILFTVVMFQKLGLCKNAEISQQLEDIQNRPSENDVTAYSFIKQNFFYRAVAANEFEKTKQKMEKKRWLFC